MVELHWLLCVIKNIQSFPLWPVIDLTVSRCLSLNRTDRLQLPLFQERHPGGFRCSSKSSAKSQTPQSEEVEQTEYDQRSAQQSPLRTDGVASDGQTSPSPGGSILTQRNVSFSRLGNRWVCSIHADSVLRPQKQPCVGSREDKLSFTGLTKYIYWTQIVFKCFL